MRLYDVLYALYLCLICLIPRTASSRSFRSCAYMMPYMPYVYALYALYHGKFALLPLMRAGTLKHNGLSFWARKELQLPP